MFRGRIKPSGPVYECRGYVCAPIRPLALRKPRNSFCDMNPLTDLPGEVTPASSRFVTLLSGLGVTHVVTIPDNTSAPLLLALAKDDPIRVVYATREGEAIALASGLWLGGACPAVLIQNTGLLEAGDGLRGTASRMGVPLVLLTTCRGYPKARSAGLDPTDGTMDRDILVRSDLDSVAHMTETTLRAWGIPFMYMVDPSDSGCVTNAFNLAQEEKRPVALLLDTSFG
jgi:sulfopyruvate decarboxylase subunit alpha